MRSRRIIATFVLHCMFNTFNDNTSGFINRQEIRTKSRLIVTASLLHCIFLQHDIRTHAVPSYHFIILVSITPVRAKITGYKIKGRDHCRTGRDHWPSSPKQAEITQAEIANGRDHRNRVATRGWTGLENTRYSPKIKSTSIGRHYHRPQ